VYFAVWTNTDFCDEADELQFDAESLNLLASIIILVKLDFPPRDSVFLQLVNCSQFFFSPPKL
jgi:hypothetical protein